MAVTYTVNQMIESVKNRAMIPENQVTFKEVDFLRFMNEELDMGIVPMVMSLHEDYFLRPIDIPLESKDNYPIPERAVGNKLRDVGFKDLSGNIFEMTRVGVGDISQYQGSFISQQFRVFYIQNNEVVLLPTLGNSSPTGSLRMTYYCSPNTLVPESRGGTILDIDRNNGVITLTADQDFPEHFSTTIQYDFIASTNPFVTRSMDLTATTLNSTARTLTFDPDDIPTNLAIGDYVMKAKESIIPQIPAALHVLLAQRVACRCLEAMGDLQNLQAANLKLAELENKAGMIIDNRVEDAPMKIVNRHSVLRFTSFNKYRRGR